VPKQAESRLPVFAMVWMTVVGAVLVLMISATAAQAADPVSREVTNRINALRAQRGLPTLRVDSRLEHAARFQSGAMRAHRSLAHGWPSGRPRLTRLAGRVHASTLGEVIGWIRYRSVRAQAAGIVGRWMRSPSHYAVIMGGNYRSIGVGRRIGRFRGNRAVWFTADLAA
jgi:uncharacterized protein YkwD